MFETDITKVRSALEKGCCPDCGSTNFLKGPSGGLNDKIECLQCGADFNCGPLNAVTERIGWNHSGRWHPTPLFLEGT